MAALDPCRQRVGVMASGRRVTQGSHSDQEHLYRVPASAVAGGDNSQGDSIPGPQELTVRLRNQGDSAQRVTSLIQG
eukprot:bmy_18264T0